MFWRLRAASRKLLLAGSLPTKKHSLSCLNGLTIASKSWVLGYSNSSVSTKIRRSSKSLAESMILRARSLYFALIGNSSDLGTGPCALPPPARCGARLLPCLAAPLPFCGVGFLPEPATSPDVLTRFHTDLPLCSKYSKALWTTSRRRG